MPGEYSSKRNLLFDLDGTLVDSTAAHARAYVETLKPVHPNLAEDFDYRQVTGQPTRQVFRELGFEEPELTSLTNRKQELFRIALANAEVSLFPGAMVLLQELQRQKKLLFLVTGASRISALLMLESTKIGELFAAVITGDEGIAGKPSPAPYLRILDDFRLPREECLAIEDGESGVKAAQAAGIDVVLIHSEIETHEVVCVPDCAELANMLLS